MTGALIFSMAVTAALGVLLGVGVMTLANRSPRWAAALAPFVALVAMVAGIATGTQQMVIADDTRASLWWIMVATLPVATPRLSRSTNPSQGFRDRRPQGDQGTIAQADRSTASQPACSRGSAHSPDGPR